jgi:hypothetical protein
MLGKWLTIGVATAAIATGANAQSPTSSAKAITPLVPRADMTASTIQSIPAFLESIQKSEGVQQAQRATVATARDCPMPVHHPDTSRLERMRVAQPSSNVSYSMPRAELKCFNPLDTSK